MMRYLIQIFFCVGWWANAFQSQGVAKPGHNWLPLFGLASSQDHNGSEDGAPVHLAYRGGGIFFYWQAGVITYLREQGYDLSKTSSTGASAGALTATLTACDVDFYKATDLALEMAKEAGVWDRPGGLQGVWGPLIREWLDTLLPANAVARMKEHDASILITPFPLLGKERICSFTDRQDLIDCNMASVHIPLFLDRQFTAKFRSQDYIDGSILSKSDDYKSLDKCTSTLYLDHSLDSKYNSKSILEFVRALEPDGIYSMIEDGKKYGKLIEEEGAFSDVPLIESPSRIIAKAVSIFMRGNRSAFGQN